MEQFPPLRFGCGVPIAACLADVRSQMTKYPLNNSIRSRAEVRLPPARWVGFVVYTVFIFTELIREFRHDWKDRRLWLSLAALLVCHTALYAWALSVVTEWRNIWFLPLTIGDFAVLFYALNGRVRKTPKARPKREDDRDGKLKSPSR
jgi:hypothetical protein